MTVHINIFIEDNITLPESELTSKIIELKIKKICKFLKLKKVALSLILCDDTYIHNINKEYRNKDKPTDIIAFAYRENPFPDVKTKFESLGDIFISLETAIENSKLFETSFQDEMKRLFIHGILHLIGFDHEKSAEDDRLMKEKEKQIFENI